MKKTFWKCTKRTIPQKCVISSLLRGAGIEFMTTNEGIESLIAAGQIGGLNPAVGPVQFLVRASDLERAKAVLTAN